MGSRRAVWCNPEEQIPLSKRVTALVRILNEEDAWRFSYAYLIFPEDITGNISVIESAARTNRWEKVREYLGWLQDQVLHSQNLIPGNGLPRKDQLALFRPEQNPEVF